MTTTITTITAILISITIYSFIIYIEGLLFDIKNENNTNHRLRFIASVLFSVLLGVIYLIH